MKEARDFFVRHEIGFDAAMVLLDLGTVYDRRGEAAKLSEADPDRREADPGRCEADQESFPPRQEPLAKRQAPIWGG